MMCRSTEKNNDPTIPIYDPEDHEDVLHSNTPSSPTESVHNNNSQIDQNKSPEGNNNTPNGNPIMNTATTTRRRIPRLVAPMVHRVSKSAFVFKVVAGAAVVISLAFLSSPPEDNTKVVRVAMVGNSLMYYNDMPRVLHAMSKGRLHQNSCLHGNADFSSHLWYGNGMYDKWTSGQARMWDIEDVDIYDYGACSVQQLLFGKDDRLFDNDYQAQYNYQQKQGKNYSDDDSVYAVDDAYETVAPADAWQYELLDDGTNPCLVDDNYNQYQQALYEVNGRPKWDFVLFNDNTRTPCCTDQREESMQLLENVYFPWLEQIGAAPIFMVTYGYWAPGRDMSGLVDIPTFASLTYNGYEDYARLAKRVLPESLQPRIAPVGLAFLMVYEESPSLFDELMHNDYVHPSPSGTFLQACVVHATIFGRLPDTSIFEGEEGPDRLWRWARRMTPVDHEYKPFPTVHQAQYLYHIAHRVAILGEKPKSLQLYPANTTVDFTPDDSLYSSTAKQDGQA